MAASASSRSRAEEFITQLDQPATQAHFATRGYAAMFQSVLNAEAAVRKAAMHIPGTNLTPYMVARGRQPSLPLEIERQQLGDAIPDATIS